MNLLDRQNQSREIEKGINDDIKETVKEDTEWGRKW